MSKKSSNFASKILTSMKKSSILFVLCIALFGFLFTSCNGKAGDVLEGTWIGDMGISSSAIAEEVEMTYVFDGKGNYTFTSSQYGEVHITKGTYKLIDGKYLHTYFSMKNSSGENEERDEVLELDTSSKPYTLNTDLYDMEGRLVGHLKFVKQ